MAELTRDEVLKRMLKTPPKPHASSKAKRKAKAGTKASRKVTGGKDGSG